MATFSFLATFVLLLRQPLGGLPKWQQTDELAVGAARDGFEAALVVAVAADR